MIRRGFPNIVILIGIVVFALSVIGGYLWISTKQLEKTVLETPNTGRQQIIEPPPKPEIEEPKETPFERVEREEVLEELEKPKKIIPSPTEKLPEESEKPQEELALPETRPEIPETMAFEVKVPSNTPEEDLIFLRYWHPTPPVGVSEVTNAIQMERVAPFTKIQRECPTACCGDESRGGVASSVFRRCKANSSDEGMRIRATDTPQLAGGRFIPGTKAHAKV